MPLLLKTVPPAQGRRWLLDAWRLFLRRPVAFSGLFATFVLALVLSTVLAPIGPLVIAGCMPVVSLGFMVAAESALNGGPVHAGQLIEPLRGDAGKRRSLLLLCVIYALGSVAVAVVPSWLDGGAFGRLLGLLQRSAPLPEVTAALAAPGTLAGVISRLVLATAVAVPFWHAAALVHWGGQKPAQALFSSTLAVWRCRGAFLVYGLVLSAVMMGMGLATALLMGLIGLPANFVFLLSLVGALVLSAVFYVSVLFTFNDSFGQTPPAGSAARSDPDLTATA